MSLLAFLLLGCIYGAQSSVTIINSWPGGRYEAWLSMTATQDLNGWTAEIRLSKWVSNFEIWEADFVSISGDGKTVTIKDKGWNGNVPAGGKIEMNFVGNTDGEPPSGVACFVGQCDGGGTPPGGPGYNYAEVLEKSILFYEAQRSGWLPDNNRVHWRWHSATDDKGYNGEDLEGGWYDAGDYVKFGFPMAGTTTTLAWGMLDFQTGYEKAGQMNWGLDCIRWPLNYFRKAHVAPNVLYGQVGDGHVDHGWWGRPEDMPMARPAWSIWPENPGSDLAGETAAAMAASSMVFKQHGDPAFADDLLKRARELYDFAYNHRGRYSDAIPNAQDFYGSWGYEDELCFGAAWLHRATGEQQYFDKAVEFVSYGAPKFYSWDDKTIGCQLLLYRAGKTDLRGPIEDFLRQWFPGGSIPYTPKGLAWGDTWGVNRYASNAAMVALLAAQLDILPSESINFARSQIHYILGDNGRSYVIGFGHNPPQRPHHASSSCPSWPASCTWDDYYADRPNPHTLYGALVGGPDVNDGYHDDRTDWIKNEVATDYNAGFQSAVAGLNSL